MIANEHQRERIRAIAIDAYPNEAVAAITADGAVVRLTNVASDPLNSFAVAQSEYDQCGEVACLVHSHPNGPLYPSEADMRTQLALGVPFGIIESRQGGADGYFEFGGSHKNLHDRPFRHGVTDCYALIKDWYSEELGITLPEFPRSWGWWSEGGNLYMDGFLSAGFEQIENKEMRRGDMIFFEIRGHVCHAGVYLGNGEVFHHLGGINGYDPSRKPMIDSIYRWSKFIHSAYRHKEARDGKSNG